MAGNEAKIPSVSFDTSAAIRSGRERIRWIMEVGLRDQLSSIDHRSINEDHR